MKRSWLIYLIVILMTMLFTTVVSFAGSSYDKKTVPGGNAPAAEKTLIDQNISADKLDQIRESLKGHPSVSTASYDDPEMDDEDFLELYYPEPWSSYYLGSTMDVEFSVYDTWADNDIYTRPLLAIFDSGDNLVHVVESDIADVDCWTDYSGSISLYPWRYHAGTYEMMILNVPCYIIGTYVEDWADWEDIPTVLINFTILKNNQQVVVSAKTTKIKASKLKKKAKAIYPIAVSNAQGTVTYQVVGGKAKAKKTLKLNPWTGKISVKKKAKKGKYTISVMVTSAGNAEYNPWSTIVNGPVRVK